MRLWTDKRAGIKLTIIQSVSLIPVLQDIAHFKYNHNYKTIESRIEKKALHKVYWVALSWTVKMCNKNQQ